jgi:hypothetical protein
MNERRRERLVSFLEDELPLFFRGELDLAPGVLVSIVLIDVKPSGGSAHISVTVYPDSEAVPVAEMLKKSENKAAHYIRTRLRTKYAPVVTFHVVPVVQLPA